MDEWRYTFKHFNLCTRGVCGDDGGDDDGDDNNNNNKVFLIISSFNRLRGPVSFQSTLVAEFFPQGKDGGE
jgi:hypothetical protein